jgi:hypothetical protein
MRRSRSWPPSKRPLVRVAALFGVALVLRPAFAGAQTPAPQASPLREIGHVHTSAFCETLRRDLFPANAQLLQNDRLIHQGIGLLETTSQDTADNTPSEAITGGGSSDAEMNAYRLASLSQQLDRSLGIIDALLDDPKQFAQEPSSDDDRELAMARGRLMAVETRQRAALTILSTSGATNDKNDLRSHRDVIPYEHDMSSAQTPAYAPVNPPAALRSAETEMHDREADAAATMLPIAAQCK